MTNHKPRGILPAQAHDLAALADYAEGSIVSRILGQTDGGSLTVFAFDAGQALSEHTSPYNAYVQVLEGTVTLTIGGIPLTVQAGQVALMPAGIPHAVAGPGRFKMLLTMLKE
jgi:quercetin dioxygenase-like cupin family protein